MGLMDDPTSGAQLVVTPHPVTLDGQRHLAAELRPGEKLGPFLRRTVDGWADDAWEVRVNGVLVPVKVLDRVRPKATALVEVRGLVRKQVLYIVALAALTYFTFGFGSAAAGAWGAGAAMTAFGGGLAGALFATGVYVAGSMLINKALGPKPSGATAAQQSDPVYSVGSARNAPRPYEPLPLLFGTVRITPDVASMPYTWIEGVDQILGMVLTPGLNVHSIEPLYNGDTLLSSYDGVATYLNGFPGHADQAIPLYSNADTLAGGELNKNATWIERTTPLDTVRVQINLEYMLGDVTSKGRPHNNAETVEVQYRATGSGTWLPLISRRFVNNTYDTRRATLAADVARGQYDVRVRRLGQAFEEKNGKASFQYVTLTAVQADDTDYTGIPRIGLRIKATGQLNGALDEVRCIAHSRPVPVWDGSGWTTQLTSNPGAHLLAYARGGYDSNGRLLFGIGLPDAQIDIPALQAFMVHCADNAYTYDAYIKDGRNHQEMVDALALAGFGQTTWAGGKFSVVWASAQQPLTGVVNMATMKRGSFQVDYTLANAADGIEYTYVDPETWQTTTLRVEAPGVTTMHNPARITGEGVTDEAHAAQMARYHLAQSLYQYKDIGYSTDLEHLTYRRMSLLALSHDMTQWGYGGRLRGATMGAGRIVTLQLDEPVPALSTRHIGLRIPGEGVYRVFPVAAFAGESDTLTLGEAWPLDAALPGDADDNPAHDTLWIYDIKATPGYRVRVVQIEPESDLKGARVAVVPESPEFWTYVETGEYTPPANESLLQGRPVASNVAVSERQVVQGDTQYTELVVTFDVTGKMAYATVHAAQQLDGEWGDSEAVLLDATLTASLPEVVGGIEQDLDTVTQAQVDAQEALDQEIQDRAQGDLDEATARGAAIEAEAAARAAALLAEAEARSDAIAAEAQARADAILAEAAARGAAITGVETLIQNETESLAQQIAQVSAGTGEQFDPWAIWHFAAGAEGWTATSGAVVDGWLQLGTSAETSPYAESPALTGLSGLAYRYAKMRIRRTGTPTWRGWLRWITASDGTWGAVKQVTIPEPTWDANGVATVDFRDIPWPDNVVGIRLHLIAGPTDAGSNTIAHDWIAVGRPSPGASSAALQQESTARASGDLAEAAARNTLAAQLRGTYEGTDVALVASGLIHSERVARAAADTVNGNAISVEVSAREALQAQVNHATTGLPATRARLITEETARADADTALASRATALEGSVNNATTGLAATRARLITEETTRANADTALANRATALESSVNDGATGLAATRARLLTEETTRADGDTANATAIQLVRAGIGDSGDNLVLKSRFEDGTLGQWSNNAVGSALQVNLTTTHPSLSRVMRVERTAVEGPEGTAALIKVRPSDVFDVAADVNTQVLTGGVTQSFRLYYYDKAGALISSDIILARAGGAVGYETLTGTSVAPAGAVTARATITTSGTPDTTPGYWTNITVRRRSAAELANASAYTSMDGRVSTAEGVIEATAEAVTGVQATVAGHTASIVQLAEVSASAAMGNGVLNPGFENADYGWAGVSTNPQATIQSTVARTGSALRVAAGAGQQTFHGSGDIPCVPNEPLPAGFWLRTDGAGTPNGYARIAVRWLNAAKSQISFVGTTISHTGLAAAWVKIAGTLTPPAGAAYARITLQTSHTSGAAYVFDDVFAEPLSQTARSLRARHTVALDVNGRISGTINENDGQTSQFSILADIFRVLGAGAEGMEWQNGYLRVYGSGYQRILGYNFGVAGQNLVDYFGPNVGAANASKTNATMYMDKGGNAYWGGSLSAGVLKNALTTTALATLNLELINGPFTTNGNVRSVTISYSRLYRRTGQTISLASGFTAGAGSNTARVRVYRKIGGAAETLWQTLNVTGSTEITNQADEVDNATLNWGGSMTVNDTSSAAQTVTYRAVIDQFTEQSVTYNGSGEMAPTITSNLTIVSIEQ